MSGSLHNLGLLLRLRLLQLRRGRATGGQRTGRTSSNRLLLRVVVLGALALFLAFTMGHLLSNVVSGSIGRLLLTPLLTLVSTWATLLLFLFAVPTVLAAFTYSSDLRLLLLTPLSPRLLLAEKFLLLYAGFAVPVLVVGGVVLLGVGQTLSEGVGYDVVALIVLALLPIAPLALAMVLTVLVLRWVPPARARSVTAVLGAALGVAVYIGSQLLSTHSLRQVGSLQQTIAQSSHAWWSSLPTTWLGQALAATSGSDLPSTTANLVATIVVSAVLAAVAIMLTAQLFASGWASFQEVGRRTRPVQTGDTSSAARPALPPMTGTMRPATSTVSTQGGLPRWWPLIGKEWRSLIREPSQWARLLYPLAVILFGFYRTFNQNTTGLDQETNGTTSALSIGWLFGTLAFMSYLLASVLTMPVINREGRALHLLSLSPLSAREILQAKWTFCVLPVLTLTEVALLIAAIVLKVSIGVIVLGVLAQIALVVALVGLNLLISLIWPRLDWDNPRQQVSGTASLVGLLCGLILVAAHCTLLILTILWSSNQQSSALLTGAGLFLVSGALILLVALVAPTRLAALLRE